jgi:hypothetical protein
MQRVMASKREHATSSLGPEQVPLTSVLFGTLALAVIALPGMLARVVGATVLAE